MEAATKRKRAFYPKVRTGCLTCKTRKVKCDQGKPHCKRCTSTGRKCDGYNVQTAVSPPTSLTTTHQGLFSSEAEKRSFHYFRTRASQPLGGYFHVSFWGREVLLAALHYPPVRHLVIALGAAYEEFETAPLQAGRHEDGVSGMELAIQQCNRSIRHLSALSMQAPTGQQPTETVCCVLTASVLFIYLASIRGHFAEAIQHVQSSIKVLQDFDKSAEHRPPHVASRAAYPVPISELRALLISIYGQLRTMVEDTALMIRDSEDMLASELKPATLFLSVSDAHDHVEKLFHNMQAFLQGAAINPPSSPEQLEAVVARHRELCQVLESSCNALDVLATSTEARRNDDAATINGIAVLRIYHILISVRLRIDILHPEEREAAFDGLESELQEMLSYCEFLVNNNDPDEEQYQQKPAAARPPTCSSGLGYIMPLHTIAARCRNPRIRRRAIQLLARCARREGIWDGSIAGKIASQTADIEEWQSLHPADADNHHLQVLDTMALEDRRVREVKLRFRGEKAAVAEFITVGDWKQGQGGFENLYEW